MYAEQHQQREQRGAPRGSRPAPGPSAARLTGSTTRPARPWTCRHRVPAPRHRAHRTGRSGQRHAPGGQRRVGLRQRQMPRMPALSIAPESTALAGAGASGEPAAADARPEAGLQAEAEQQGQGQMIDRLRLPAGEVEGLVGGGCATAARRAAAFRRRSPVAGTAARSPWPRPRDGRSVRRRTGSWH